MFLWLFPTSLIRASRQTCTSRTRAVRVWRRVQWGTVPWAAVVELLLRAPGMADVQAMVVDVEEAAGAVAETWLSFPESLIAVEVTLF